MFESGSTIFISEHVHLRPSSGCKVEIILHSVQESCVQKFFKLRNFFKHSVAILLSLLDALRLKYIKSKRPRVSSMGFNKINQNYWEFIFDLFQEVNRIWHSWNKWRSSRRCCQNEISFLSTKGTISESLIALIDERHIDQLTNRVKPWSEEFVVSTQEVDFIP